jgi:hypothetical protein
VSLAGCVIGPNIHWHRSWIDEQLLPRRCGLERITLAEAPQRYLRVTLFGVCLIMGTCDQLLLISSPSMKICSLGSADLCLRYSMLSGSRCHPRTHRKSAMRLRVTSASAMCQNSNVCAICGRAENRRNWIIKQVHKHQEAGWLPESCRTCKSGFIIKNHEQRVRPHGKPTCRALDLSWNRPEDAGTGAICRALSSNQV